MGTQGNKALIERTLELWQPRTRRELKPEDGRQMIENMSGFFGVLAEWERRRSGKQAKEHEGRDEQ